MPAQLKLKPKVRRTPASKRLKASRALKKWEKGSAGKKFARVMADPAKRARHIKMVTIPKYKAWIKAAQAELKTAKGPAKTEVKRKLDNHKIRLKMARQNLIAAQKTAKNKSSASKPKAK